MDLATSLPPSLRERLRPQTTGASPREDKAHVLYVMRTAYRCDANPSVEVALRAAHALSKPLVCLAVLEDSFPARMRGRAPTDRATAFRLEALRESDSRVETNLRPRRIASWRLRLELHLDHASKRIGSRRRGETPDRATIASRRRRGRDARSRAEPNRV